MITLNPAKQLGIDKRTGSIETCKAADIVIWTAHPFSVYARPEITMIEGEIYFDRAKDLTRRAAGRGIVKDDYAQSGKTAWD